MILLTIIISILSTIFVLNQKPALTSPPKSESSAQIGLTVEKPIDTQSTDTGEVNLTVK